MAISALLVKKKQRLVLAALLGVFLFVCLPMLFHNEENPERRSAGDRRDPYQGLLETSLPAQTIWIEKAQQEVSELAEQTKALEHQLAEAEKKAEEEKAQMKSQSARLEAHIQALTLQIERLSASQSEATRADAFSARQAIAPLDWGSDLGKPVQEPSAQDFNPSIRVVSLKKENIKAEEKVDEQSAFLPAGSFISMVMLTGVEAPTGGAAKASPVPVLMKANGTAQLPNFSNLEVKDCFFTGAAYGDLSSERVYIRLERISLVLSDSRVIEVPVAGYCVGEDGRPGFSATLKNKQGSLLAKSLLAGTLSGLSNGLTQAAQKLITNPSGTVTATDPEKFLQASLGKGGSNALEKLADFYMERANELYPVLCIDSGRIGELVINVGTELAANEVKLGALHTHKEGYEATI